MPFGPDLLFRADRRAGFVLHVEVCEDMWVPVQPSHEAALAGATILTNLSGSPITVSRAEDRHLLARSASARCLAAYLYAAAGEGESSTDLSWDRMTMVYENGALLAESERFPRGPGPPSPTSTSTCSARSASGRALRRQPPHARPARTDGFRTSSSSSTPPTGDLGLLRKVDRFPFVPDDEDRSRSTATRRTTSRSAASSSACAPSASPRSSSASAAGSTRPTRSSSRPRPWTASTGRAATSSRSRCRASRRATTRAQRDRAMESLDVTWEELDIRPAATQMFEAMGHPYGRGEEVYDVTFENVQAGLRTDYLFRIANQRGGIVLGTGDLSELALGWCTYGVGDQMSHYGVNTGVPKTLMQHLIGGSSRRASSTRRSRPRSPRSSTPRSRPSSCRRRTARSRRAPRP